MGCCGSKQDIEKNEKSNQKPQNKQNNQSQGREQIEKLVQDIVNSKKALPLELDFHGWYLSEAQQVLPVYIDRKPKEDVCLITGRGLHAEDNKPKIKPYVLETLRKGGFDYYVHHQGGRCTVNFNKGTKVERKFKEVEDENAL
ncbi:hypothetical protein BLNAU_2904 [Blattamonas nauphoetae]|uniref:Smr domain-containing protein n=1 Tax=Blattamonas nauphoetae TaxID=2049346 RepID=A0ABQ9YEV4_9EUKA|nr:hypothetical protein BLNAU_2904 [Blattamonas nauphoetae]